jgi:hypothetical protein
MTVRRDRVGLIKYDAIQEAKTGHSVAVLSSQSTATFVCRLDGIDAAG